MADDAPDTPTDSDDKTTKTDRTGYYLEAIERYEKGTQEWHERCKKIVRIYLDQHRQKDTETRRFALLWSNIETLKPAVYARLPQAVVSRRFKDADPVGRKAAEVQERCINSCFDLYGLDEVMRSVRDDRLITARGTAWVRYEAEVDDEANAVKSERLCYDFVHWSDFGHALARTWSEVNLVWRRVYLTKDKAKARFGEKADKLTYEMRPELMSRTDANPQVFEPQATIYEIWDRDNKEVCWIAKEERITLDAGDPPLALRNFYPCPEPSYGTRTTGSLIPTPDYRYYQDQAEEIDDITNKIAALSEWLKVKAFIPAGPSADGGNAIIAMLQSLTDKAKDRGIFVPVESWAGFTEKGGSRQIDWLPIDMVISTIKAAIECRQQLIQDVFQITGISDILRGETDPNETLGAQQLKAQTGSRRISTMQRDISRFARDIAEISGEIIADVFQPQTMTAMSGIDLTAEPPPQLQMQIAQLQQQIAMAQQAQQAGQPVDPQMMQQLQQQMQQAQGQLQQIQQNAQVIQLLRDDKTRGFRIEIETDSTIEPDEQAEKQRRIEFVETMGQFLQQAVPLIQAMPAAAPLVGESLLFLSRGFRAGRSLEEVIEQTMEKVQQVAQQPPPPDPKLQAVQVKAQAEQQKAQMDMQAAQQEHAMAMQKMQGEMAKMQAELQIAMQELGIKREAAAIDREAMQHKAILDERTAALQGEATERKHEIGMETMAAKAAQGKAQ